MIHRVNAKKSANGSRLENSNSNRPPLQIMGVGGADFGAANCRDIAYAFLLSRHPSHPHICRAPISIPSGPSRPVGGGHHPGPPTMLSVHAPSGFSPMVFLFFEIRIIFSLLPFAMFSRPIPYNHHHPPLHLCRRSISSASRRRRRRCRTFQTPPRFDGDGMRWGSTTRSPPRRFWVRGHSRRYRVRRCGMCLGPGRTILVYYNPRLWKGFAIVIPQTMTIIL